MLFLHIGTHKTGTSALQTFLLRRADDLDERGVHYIRAGLGDGTAHHALSWTVRGQYAGEMTLWEGVRDEIAAHPDAVNVLSSEAFWFTDPQKVWPQLKDVGPVRIVAYLRRQDQYLQSLYKQAVTGGRPMSFDEWRERFGRRGNYLKQLRGWAEVFGADNIVLRPYVRPAGRIDVAVDFFEVLGIDVADLLAQRKVQSHNPSPRLELLELFRAVNQTGIDVPRDKLFWPVMAGRRAYHRSADILNYEQCVALMAEFAECNRALEAEFHHDPSTPLFPPMEPFEPPEFWNWNRPEYFQMSVEFASALIEAARSDKTRPDNAKKKRNTRRFKSEPEI